jgi:hypothetical protein
VFHLALALPDGRVRAPGGRACVLAAYAIAAVVCVGLALFRDPLLDLYCWSNCSDNSFLIHADAGIAGRLDDLWLWSALAIALGLIAFSWRRLLGATAPGRRALLPVIGPALLVGASEATYAIALLQTSFESPDRAGFAAIFLARSLSYAMLGLGPPGAC